jgi:transcriptional regulator of acetoin/glycerol metabolism
MLPMLNVEEKSLLRSGWKEFIENGKRPIGVNPVIAASWERSSEWNVDPFLSGNCCILTKSALSEKLRQNKEILDIVKPYMRDMHQALRDLGYMMFLTDAEGWVLHAIGDKNIMDDFRETLDFQLGVSWHESVVGTTAVGIALHHCEPVPFIAEEKYCLILKDRACAAAPIKGADSGTVAVLGLATNLHKVIRLDNTIFALLCAAQAAIENKLQLIQTKETLQVINSRYQKVFENVSDAIVTVDSKGNAQELRSLGNITSALLKGLNYSSSFRFLQQEPAVMLHIIRCGQQVLWKVFRPDYTILSKHYTSFDHIFQFANVPRPVVFIQYGFGFIVQSIVNSTGTRMPPQQILNNEIDVFSSLRQGRQAYTYDIKPPE